MRFLSGLFNSNKVECPGCLGKGDVKLEDIKRFKKELYWMPGKCAYCNGVGKVTSKKIEMLGAGIGYLTTDLPEGERKKLLNGDTGALQRAREHEEEINKIIKQIEHLYYIENQEAEQIADYLLSKYGTSGNSPTERPEIIEYIEKVIKSKLTNN